MSNVTTSDEQLKTKQHILVVDDEPTICSYLELILTSEGFEVTAVSSISEAMRSLDTASIEIMITDLCIGDESGLDLISQAGREHPDTETILLTGYGSIENAVESMRAGAFDYLTKPFSNDQLVLKVRKALEHRRMRLELSSLRQQVAMSYGFDNIVGESKPILKLKETAARVAPTDITILIGGASGTGKELLAKAIHHHSKRRRGPFVAIDCTAIPETLLESELFGHVKGSFTSAVNNRRGLFEEANGGTIFLDEVNNMPMSVQPKLLRFLQDSVIRPVGSSTSKKVDVRILAASNADLAELVMREKFREDLYYRLNVIPLNIPTLSERGEDVERLAEYFLRRICQEAERPGLDLSRDALTLLLSHSWPGNVRELENTLKRAVALCQGTHIDSGDILFVASHHQPKAGPSDLSGPLLLKGRSKLLVDNQRSTIQKALEDNNWNFTQTAQDLGIGRTTLWRKVKKYKLQRRTNQTQEEYEATP